MLHLFYIFFLVFSSSQLFSEVDNRPFYILRDRHGAGMFSMFGDVLALCDSYEKKVFRGIEVDFGKDGLYYESGHGSNWWSYYCEPIAFGSKHNVLKATAGGHTGFSPIFFYKNREEAYKLVKKYIIVKPHIANKVSQFKNEYLKDFTIGVHYRGTDANNHNSYDSYFREIKKVIQNIGTTDFRIFIATDEQPFIDFISKIFPGKVCFQQNALRSKRGGPPLHINNHSGHYRQGEEALIDCLLLAECSMMVLSYSNLSLWACLFNPNSQIIDVSNRLSSIGVNLGPYFSK